MANHTSAPTEPAAPARPIIDVADVPLGMLLGRIEPDSPLAEAVRRIRADVDRDPADLVSAFQSAL